MILLDVIVSDHKPEDEESKRLPFAQAAYRIYWSRNIAIFSLRALS